MRVSVVVPTYNGESVITETLIRLQSRLTNNDEVIVVVNGSTDRTFERATDFATNAIGVGPAIRITKSEKGLGCAYQSGVLEAKGQFIVLTADDLPFGFSDWESVSELTQPSAIAIGSKAHKQSKVHRSFLRSLLSRIFLLTRRILLKSRVGDTQGTFFLQGEWVKHFARKTTVADYMWTTYLVSYAETRGLVPVELPVDLDQSHGDHGTRIGIVDILQSFVSLVTLRKHIKTWTKESKPGVPSTLELENFPILGSSK